MILRLRNLRVLAIAAILLSVLAEAGTESRAADAAAKKPNVLFLFADDMRSDSIAALGDPTIRTPNLDRLVERGFSFRNAYCLGGNSPAVCMPSRNMLLSGKAYFRWQGPMAPGEGLSFPASFAKAGYETYHHGKRSNTAIKIQARFDTDKYLKDLEDRTCGEPGKKIVDDAIAFLADRQDARPWCMYLAFANPHDPRVADQKYLDQYDLAKIPLPANFLPQHPFDDGEMAIRDEQLAPWPRPKDEMRRQWRDYYAVITALDGHIGRLLDALEKSGTLENTIVVFSADQGIALGSHGLLGKQNLYDVAMKSPLVLAGPGIPRGRSDALVYLLDIYPTLCDLVGAPVAENIDGRTFRPVLEGKTNAARDELFLAYRSVQRAIRDDRWKLIRYPEVDVTQLFDLKSDPDEMHDLAGDPSQAERVKKLLARLRAAQPHWGDDLALTVENPKPREWTPPKGK